MPLKVASYGNTEVIIFHRRFHNQAGRLEPLGAACKKQPSRISVTLEVIELVVSQSAALGSQRFGVRVCLPLMSAGLLACLNTE